MKDNHEMLENFLEPKKLKENLIFISLFISIYESFKETIIENVKYFYWSGIKDRKAIFKDYEKEVLNKVTTKKNKKIIATLNWFKENGAITEDDIENFKKITSMRNSLVHEMSNKLFEGLSNDVFELYIVMIELFEKITKWWIKEIEIPISGDFTVEQYENILWDEVTSVKLEFLKIMFDIAVNNNEEYYKILKDNK